MRRDPTSIVILAWNAWDETKACLESLRPTLGTRDQVIIVDNGSTDRTPIHLRSYPWLEVITNPENRGFAGGCNQGATAARHDTIVFLNNDTVLTGHWLDALLEPLTDPEVGASGPRSNFVSGPQIAEGASYAPSDMSAMRHFARTWSQEHRGQVTDIDRLVGFCIAVRRDAFERIGGFDVGYEVGGFEDDDLCRRLAGAGYRLVIAHESFVHHTGHKTFDANDVDWYAQQERNRARFEEKFGSSHDHMLVSACLITKDEEDNLPSCLASLKGLADEVVIYDTGSTDRTVAIARDLGATVIEGYWDDDFSRARNEALARCSGTWIAWLDADETVACDDLPGIRRLLMGTPLEVDGFSVPIDNLIGNGFGTPFVHSATRLFRRAQCEWTGRLHEQIAGRGSHRSITQLALDGFRLRHTGYLDTVMTARGKVERNLRVAAAEVEDANSWDRGFSLVSLGRSYLTAGRLEEALHHCSEGVQQTKNAVTRRLGLRTQVECLLALKRFDEAETKLAELRACSDRQILVELLTARLLHDRGKHAEALDAFDAIEWRRRDDDGFEYDASMHAKLRADILVALGRHGEAADTLLAVLADKGMLDLHLGTVIEYLRQANRSLTAIADALPTDKQPVLLAQLLQLNPAAADEVLEACWPVISSPAVLATALSLCPRLTIERRIVWSSRLRERGLADNCPLLAAATSDAELPSVRVRHAAVAFAAFGDQRGKAALAVAAANLVGTAQRTLARAEVAALAPMLLDTFDAAVPPPQAFPTGTQQSAPYTASIVLVTPGNAERTAHCLQRIAELTAPEDYEVIVVGNAADEETAALGAALQGDAQYHHLAQPVGLAEAFIAGIHHARGRVLVLLTTAVDVTPRWLVPLLDAVDHGFGAVGPLVVGANELVYQAGLDVVVDSSGRLHARGHDFGRPAKDVSAGVVPSQALGSAGLTVPAELYRDIGGFDINYNFELAAVDLTLRLASAGHAVAVVGAGRLVQRVPEVRPDHAERVAADEHRFTAEWLPRVSARTFHGELSLATTSQVECCEPSRPPTGYYGYERPEVIALVPTDAHDIVDVGCAAGRLGAALKRRQPCRVTGIEVNPSVADIARSAIDEVIVADLNRESLKLHPRTVDCVICADVLEHLVDPWSALDCLYSALRPGGTLVASIPNIRNLAVLAEIAEGDFTYRPAGILDRTHLRFFTRSTAHSMITGAGFTVESVSAVLDPAIPIDESSFVLGPQTICSERLSISSMSLAEARELSTVQFLFLARKTA